MHPHLTDGETVPWEGAGCPPQLPGKREATAHWALLQDQPALDGHPNRGQGRPQVTRVQKPSPCDAGWWELNKDRNQPGLADHTPLNVTGEGPRSMSGIKP